MPWFQFKGSARPDRTINRLSTKDINNVQRDVPLNGTIELDQTVADELRGFIQLPGVSGPSAGTTTTVAPKDVAIVGSPLDGDTLKWNAAQGAWMPSAGGGAAAADSPTVKRVEVYGHSIAAGYAAEEGWNFGYAARVAFMLGAQQVFNRAVGGALACWPSRNNTGDGGYPSVLQEQLRQGQPGMQAAGAPYLPASQVAIVDYGNNDVASLGSQKLAPFREAYKTILSRICAAAVWEDEHAAWAFTGTGWATLPNQVTQNSGAQFHYTGTIGDAATFTLPADYPGGLVAAIGLFVNAGGGAMTITPNVDGVDRADIVIDAAQVTDPANAKAMHNGIVLRFGTGVAGDPAFTAGAHAIKLTLKAAPAGTNFAIDYAQVEADPADGPVIVAPLATHTLNYTLWGSGSWAHGNGAATDPYIDASVDAVRAVQNTVLDLFGNRVVRMDRDIPKDPLLFAPDGAHPNNKGHAIMAGLVYDAIQQSGVINERRLLRPILRDRERWWGVSAGINGNATFQNNYGNYRTDSRVAPNDPAALAGNLLFTRYKRDARGKVTVQGAIIPKAGATGGTTMFTLPAGFRPAGTLDFACAAYGSTNGWRGATVRVNDAGAVQWMAGFNTEPSAILTFSITFDAEK